MLVFCNFLWKNLNKMISWVSGKYVLSRPNCLISFCVWLGNLPQIIETLLARLKYLLGLIISLQQFPFLQLFLSYCLNLLFQWCFLLYYNKNQLFIFLIPDMLEKSMNHILYHLHQSGNSHPQSNLKIFSCTLLSIFPFNILLRLYHLENQFSV
jgi:hypothetical protein